MSTLALLSWLALASIGPLQRGPTVQYTLRVDSTDFAGIAVEMRIGNAAARLRIAARAHPEYDDKYWRYLEDFEAADAAGQPVAFVRRDSVVWQLDNAAGDVIVRYRVRFPRMEGLRDPWKPFLSPTGGLIGGPHSFLYVVGGESSAVTLNLELPPAWAVASGLSGAPTARSFRAADVYSLLESPMLVGHLREWSFQVRGVPHRVFYWPAPDAVSFDTGAFVRGIELLATETVALFGGMPYSEYTFLFQDGAYSGGLEHPNSVTLGAPSAELARDPLYGLQETAHEFIHTWNLMAIRPAEYRRVDYRVQPPVAGLWFSEGLTLFYADLLLRRAKLPTEGGTRVGYLESLINRYLAAPGNARFSAEEVSRVAYNASPSALGDYTASSHLQGELIGGMLDLIIRDSTDGRRSMDDVMRLMYGRFTDRGFVSKDVLRAVNEVCRCSVAAFFDAHVFSGGALDFARHLAPFGLTMDVSNQAGTRDGQQLKDLRLWGWQEGSEPYLRLRISDPHSIWGRAGLHTGDALESINGQPVRTWPQLRAFLASSRIGDTVSVVVRRHEGFASARVVMQGYEQSVARLSSVASPSRRQRRLLADWLGGR